MIIFTGATENVINGITFNNIESTSKIDDF